jgi:hypothetical protein
MKPIIKDNLMPNSAPSSRTFGWYCTLCCWLLLSVDACVFPRECFGLWCVVLLSMLVFSLVVAVSTFEQRTARRYNNTHRTYGVNLQHEGSIPELHCAKSFFSRAREDRTIVFANNNTAVECDAQPVL